MPANTNNRIKGAGLVFTLLGSPNYIVAFGIFRSNKKNVIRPNNTCKTCSVAFASTSSTSTDIHGTFSHIPNNNDIDIDMKQKHYDNELSPSFLTLSSLLDEAVLLRSRNDQPSNEDIESLIQDIAVSINVNPDGRAAQVHGATDTVEKTKTIKRTIEDVQNELDNAVLSQQALAMSVQAGNVGKNDEMENWTNKIEELAFELYELSSGLECLPLPSSRVSLTPDHLQLEDEIGDESDAIMVTNVELVPVDTLASELGRLKQLYSKDNGEVPSIIEPPTVKDHSESNSVLTFGQIPNPTSGDIDIDIKPKQKDREPSVSQSFLVLSSLLNEAVLLHSKNDQSSNENIKSLIEDIAVSIHANSGESTIGTAKRKKINKRTIRDVQKELDGAVLSQQALVMQLAGSGENDEVEKWTNKIEELASELHELSLETDSLTISSPDHMQEEHDVVAEESITLATNAKPIDALASELDRLKKVHSKGSIETVHNNDPHQLQQELLEIEEETIVIDNEQHNMPQSLETDVKTTVIERHQDDMNSIQNQIISEIAEERDTSLKEHESVIDFDSKEESKVFEESPSISSNIEPDNHHTSSVSGSTMIMNKKGDIITSTSTSTSTLESPELRVSFNNTENDAKLEKEIETDTEEVDVAIIGAGIGGLCAGSILNSLYDKKVGIYESHYLPGGCAHAFPATAVIAKDDGGEKEKVEFTFDSGPTIVLGCSTKPYNPLRQVLNVVGLSEEVEWLPYDGWGMVENPLKGEVETRWKVELGPEMFENGPLLEFGGEEAVQEFQELRKVTKVLVSGAVEIPAMAMRAGNSALIPLLRYLPALSGLIAQGEEVTQGTFGQFLDGPKFVVKNQWLRDWLDALAFSLSGLPACRTSAAAMAYVIYDMHREGAALDYPKSGLGAVVDALVKGVEQNGNGSKVHLRQHVQSIDTSPDGSFIEGITLKNGKKIIAKDGVICNAPVWSLNDLVKNEEARKVLNNSLPATKKRDPRQTWIVGEEKSQILYDRPIIEKDDESSLLAKCDTAEMTGSFLHLHLALDASGLDLESLEAHYTVMDRGIGGDGSIVDGYADGPCGELNMIAVSNPCVLDKTLAPEGYIVVHAYGAGNEPYDIWKGLDRKSKKYQELKEMRAAALWRAVESIIPDARERCVLSMIGSPITHERFLRRPRGTYGSSTEDYLKDGSTPFRRLVLCGDGVFPGIGIPAVALSGASAANTMVSPWKQWRCLDTLKKKKLI